MEALYIQRFCKAEKIKDKPQVLKKYAQEEYANDELSFVLSISCILEDDYALKSPEVKFADLTHGLSLMATLSSEGAVEIAIQRHHPSIAPVLECYNVSRETFMGFVKDYVRNYIYPQIRQWVPSSTKDGADDFRKY